MSVSWRRRSKSSEPAFDFAAICSASLRRDDTAAGLRARERDLDFHVTRDKGAVGKYFPHVRGTECVAEQDRVEDRSSGWGQRCHGEASFIITARLMVGGALSIMSWEGSASMSALGQKRTSKYLRPMSALPRKADSGRLRREVLLGPIADIHPLEPCQSAHLTRSPHDPAASLWRVFSRSVPLSQNRRLSTQRRSVSFFGRTTALLLL